MQNYTYILCGEGGGIQSDFILYCFKSNRINYFFHLKYWKRSKVNEVLATITSWIYYIITYDLYSLRINCSTEIIFQAFNELWWTVFSINNQMILMGKKVTYLFFLFYTIWKRRKLEKQNTKSTNNSSSSS